MGNTLHPHHNNALLTGAPGPLMMSAARGGLWRHRWKIDPRRGCRLLSGAPSLLDVGSARVGSMPRRATDSVPPCDNSTSVGTCSAFALLLAVSPLKALT